MTCIVCVLLVLYCTLVHFDFARSPNCFFENTIFLIFHVFAEVVNPGPLIVSLTDDPLLPEAFVQVQAAGKFVGTSSSLLAGVEARQEAEYKSS